MKKFIKAGIISLAAASALLAAPLTDMVIIIDESGSMQGEIDTVKATAGDLVQQMDDAGIDYQLGLVSFGTTWDPISPPNPEVLVPLTDNNVTFLNGIATLAAHGGAGYEPGFGAVQLGMSSAMEPLTFRPDAGTCVILMTDEDSDPEGQPEHDNNRTAAIAAMATQGAIFYGVVNTNDGSTAVDYGPDTGSLSDATGGMIWDISLLDDSVEGPKILQEIMEACIKQAVESVAFDVHPTSCPNPLNLKSGGMTPMAILGAEDFDVYDINTSTIKVNGEEIARYAYEDVATPYEGDQTDPAAKDECNELEGDGYLDLTLKIKTKDLGLAEGVQYLTVTGQLLDGTEFTGKDVVWVK